MLRDCGTMMRLDCAFWLKFSLKAWDMMYTMTAEYLATSSAKLRRREVASAGCEPQATTCADFGQQRMIEHEMSYNNTTKQHTHTHTQPTDMLGLSESKTS